MFVKVSETYDLSTKVGKMGLVGIHTPEGRLVYKHWEGLYKNYRRVRFASCDVAMACASMLPADPLQIGVEAGSIAPQDMFNPILYKACSNDSMSQILNRIYAGSTATNVDVAKNSVIASNEASFGNAGVIVGEHGAESVSNTPSQFDIYYALLSDTNGWKKAMPQAGLQMRGLYPLVWSVLKTLGQPSNWSSCIQPEIVVPGTNEQTGATNYGESNTSLGSMGQYMRGPAMRMPACDTFVATNMEGGQTVMVDNVNIAQMRDNDHSYPTENAIDKFSPTPIANFVKPNLDLPDCFVGVMILPPATLNQLYYRLKVTWTIEFTEPRPLTDLTNWYGLQSVGIQSYATDYATQTQALKNSGASVTLGMLDTSEVDAVKIMEGSK